MIFYICVGTVCVGTMALLYKAWQRNIELHVRELQGLRENLVFENNKRTPGSSADIQCQTLLDEIDGVLEGFFLNKNLDKFK